MTRHRIRQTSAVALGLCLATLAQAQTKRPITEDDLLKFVWAADPQISPDGRQVAFVRVVVNEQKDDYETSLWIVPADSATPPRRLTSGARDSAPRWSPDGMQLGFVRAVERDGRPQPAQIYVLSLDGGEARAITSVARGASNPVWSPDGSRLVFSSTTKPDAYRSWVSPSTPATAGRSASSASNDTKQRPPVRCSLGFDCRRGTV